MGKKIIILGIDAMDPNITERLMDEGKLPNFSKLRNLGSYSKLETTIPSVSVVAWTSFSTGLNPGQHGIFDFIMRNPETYTPYLSLNEVKETSKKFKLGKLRIPLKSLKVVNRNKGRNFWEILSENNIPSYIYFCPNTFPASPLKGRMLSGMGVPDLGGVIGRASFYTTSASSDNDKDSRGKIVFVQPVRNLIKTYIFGPKISAGEGKSESQMPLNIILKPEEDGIEIGFQDKSLFLRRESWSNWQRLSFRTGAFKKVHGMVRFYLKSVKPEFALYMSPINFDPRKPIFPISYPVRYSREIAQKIGFYYTQGMPHDTWALSEGRFDEEVFLQHVDMILEERNKILREELKKFKGGVFLFYFDTLDVIQHMFWRYIDTGHPLYEANSKYRDVIFEYYEKIDRILGEVLEKLDENTILIVLSDHGFSSFRRAVNLNRWLLEQGLLYLKKGYDEGKELFEGIDWSRTRAYALGFGGIYFNRIGREKHGIVDEEEVMNLKEDISQKLKQWIDPYTGKVVAKEVYKNEDVFFGSYKENGPDLFVGFNRGYRASWQTALGMVPKELIEDNKKKWSGDHLIDPGLVPGVIFLNRVIKTDQPNIIDIVPTVLSLFNLPKPKEMQGKDLFKDEIL